MMKKLFFCMVLYCGMVQQYSFAQLSSNCDEYAVFISGFPPCNENDYQLIFEDNFNGTSLDLSKWEPESSGALTINDHCEYSSPSNITVSNGSCFLTAKQQNVVQRSDPNQADNVILEDGITNLRSYNYTSGRMHTKQLFLNGKYEIRCRMPDGAGLWPAFWMFGGSVWNEIDVFDQYDDNDDYATGIGHDYDGDLDCEGCSQTYSNINNFALWHIFTCTFEFDRIIIEIDGTPIRTLYRFKDGWGGPILCGETVPEDYYLALQAWPVEDMNIILNLAIGNGNGPEVSPNASTVFPCSFEIDYVRYYRKVEICDDVEFYSTDDLHLNTNPAVNNHISGKKVIFNGNINIASGVNLDVSAQEEVRFLSEFQSVPGSDLVANIDLYGSCERSGAASMNNGYGNYIIGNTKRKSEIKLSPNPNDGHFSLQIQSSSNIQPNLYLTDLSGRIIHTQSISLQEGFNQLHISKPELPSGIYFIKVDGFDEPIKIIITQ